MPNPKLPVSENWRWPDEEWTICRHCGSQKLVGKGCVECFVRMGDVDAVQLRSDRDELWAELKAEHEAACSEYGRDCSPDCPTCALLARVKRG